jgi:DNA-binding GntR family transcriptional regulator
MSPQPCYINIVNIARHTYTQDAYTAIRGLILDGQLSPGSKIVVRVLSERLGLSPTPIKAALNALEREGFVTTIPHRGFYVSEVSAGDMREIYELREVLDGIAARKAAAGTRHRKLSAQLTTLLDRQQRSVDRGDLVGYSDLDVEFHHVILDAAGNTRLQQVADNLAAQVRFGSGSSSRLPGRLPTALHEHAAVVAAIEAGDTVVAEREARHHVRLAGEAFQHYFAERSGADRDPVS